MKKDRAEEKQKKKDAKKMAKEQKQSEKENAVKNHVQKKGRSAAEKVEGRKSKKAKGKDDAKAGEVAASDDDVKPSPSATRSTGLKRLTKMKSAKANSFADDSPDLEAVPAAVGAPESKNGDKETNQEVKSQGKKPKPKSKNRRIKRLCCQMVRTAKASIRRGKLRRQSRKQMMIPKDPGSPERDLLQRQREKRKQRQTQGLAAKEGGSTGSC